MASYPQEAIRSQLVDRRHKLTAAIDDVEDATHLEDLLQQVDLALDRIDRGSYGICDACHEPIEADRLLANPLMCLCLDHLTTAQMEALQQDLDLASRIQAGLLPSADYVSAGWEASYHYEAAGAVSGDYCDLISLDGGGLFFAMGDISGKGVAASLLMSHLHAIIRSLVPTGLPLEQLVERANRIFCQSTISSAFATLVCGRATESGDVEICNAGHCPPLTFPGDPSVLTGPTGLPIGMFADGRYSVRHFQLPRGQGFFLYTDGLVEARNREDEEYGTDRLSLMLAAKGNLPTPRPAEGVSGGPRQIPGWLTEAG